MLKVVRSFGNTVKAEVERAPLAAFFNALGSTSSAISLAIAILRPSHSAPVVIEKAVDRASLLAALLGIVGFSVLGANFSRFIYSRQKIASFFGSLVAAGVSVSLSALLMLSLNVRFTRIVEGKSVDDSQTILVWSSVLIYLAVNADKMISDFVASDNEGKTNGDVIAILGIALAIWGGLLSAGASIVVGTILTAH